MSALEQQHLAALRQTLARDFVPHLPPLLDHSKPEEETQRKNVSRALSAFALFHICGLSHLEAGAAVIDDFDDFGIDAVIYSAATETIYLVQAKLKASEQFSEVEALAFARGVRKLVGEDFTGFNDHVQKRRTEIEGALNDCEHIVLVVAHTGSGISVHAKKALDDLLEDEDHGEERFDPNFLDYDAARIVTDLRAGQAYKRVDATLRVQKCSSVSEPRVTYFGLIPLTELVKLHEKHGAALYERNIRAFLGNKTEVNTSIQATLASDPGKFLYLNNGVTVLCNEIRPKSGHAAKGGGKRLELKSLSVVNGAQTIASAARFLSENKGADIAGARVSLTLIKADSDGEFGKSVTRARNHQNPVLLANFAALDDEQERLRRDLACLEIVYSYKAEAADATSDPNRIRIDEAVQALAMLQPDPRYVVWLKKQPARLLNTASDTYKEIFKPSVSAFQLANAVRLNRYVQKRMATEAAVAYGQERLAYKHGNYAAAWVLAKRLSKSMDSASLLDSAWLETALSQHFDSLRQELWTCTQLATMLAIGPPVIYSKGPLALFRNQTYVIPLLQSLMVNHYGLTEDSAIEHKIAQGKASDLYPVTLFAYLSSKAPQIPGHA